MRVLFILLVSSLFIFAGKLTKVGDTVIDNEHKLVWQDHIHNVKVIVTHEHAIEYCEKLVQSGSSLWRVPTVKEYKFIIDKSRLAEELTIDRAFHNILKDDYWTSDRTWLRNFGQYAYYVFFKSGTIYYQNRSYPKYIRCIHDL